jgi:protein arginine kinase
MTLVRVADLLTRPCPWLSSPGTEGAVVVSSRIRLARTWADYPFHRKLSRARQEELTSRLVEHLLSVIPEGVAFPMGGLDEFERAALVERQVISRELAAAKRPGAVVLAEERDLVVAAMVNEEDHLRLQVIGPGLNLSRLLERAVAIDQAMEKRVPWSTHPRLGYLTACHTNVGTALRASCMLHLPALAEIGELKQVLRALNVLHLAVRGDHGEGSEAAGHCYQISNARSLGHDEGWFAVSIHEAVGRVAQAELLARRQMLAKARSRLEDKVFRAWGLLSTARRLTTEELAGELSWLRLGTALDVLDQGTWAIPTDRRWRILDQLALLPQPAHLQVRSGTALDAPVRDEHRAHLVRALLAGRSPDVPRN